MPYLSAGGRGKADNIEVFMKLENPIFLPSYFCIFICQIAPAQTSASIRQHTHPNIFHRPLLDFSERFEELSISYHITYLCQYFMVNNDNQFKAI